MNDTLKYVLYIVLVLIVIAAVVFLFVNNKDENVVDNNVDSTTDNTQDNTDLPSENNNEDDPLDVNAPVDEEVDLDCEDGDFECYVLSLQKCHPSIINMSASGIYPSTPIYAVDLSLNYEILGYNENDECEVNINYSNIDFKARDVTKEELRDYFKTTYNLKDDQIQESQLDNLMTRLEESASEDVIMYNNQYYDLVMNKEAMCKFSSTEMNHLLNELFDLNSQNLNNFSLFSDDRKTSVFSNCTGDLFN